MRILRPLAVGGVFGSSLLAIGFVCVDRLGHPAPVPIPAMVQSASLDPTVTGTLAPPGPIANVAAVKTEAAKPPAKPKATDGFDTERLNALMRGDPSVTLARTR